MVGTRMVARLAGVEKAPEDVELFATLVEEGADRVGVRGCGVTVRWNRRARSAASKEPPEGERTCAWPCALRGLSVGGHGGRVGRLTRRRSR
jgi:hypothetical protein